MTIRVGPDIEEATHHIKLVKADSSERGLILVDSRGKPTPTAIRRVPTRGSTVVSRPAQGRYDDRQHPYVAIEQSDWSGGRGEADFERNKTKFHDSHCMWSATPGMLTPAPAAHFTPGIGDYQMHMPYQGVSGINWWSPVNGIRTDWNSYAANSSGYTYYAYKFTALSSFTPEYALIVARAKWDMDTPSHPTGLKVGIYSHDAGNDKPNALITGWTETIDADEWPESYWGYDSDARYSQFVKLKWSSGPVLNASTTYWFVILAPGTAGPETWEVGISTNSTADTRLSADGSTWLGHMNATIPFHALFYDTTSSSVVRRFFEYKRGFYHIEDRDDGTSPTLYRHGYRGVVDSNTTTQITDAAGLADAITDETKDMAIHFVGGTGKGQERLVTANTTSTLTFTPKISASLSTDTEWVTLGTGNRCKWNPITGLSPGINNPTGDPLVVNDIVYFPQGDGNATIRYREYNNAGTWTVETASETTANNCELLTKHRKDDGTIVVVRAQNSDANGDVSISMAPVQDWGTDLVFDDPIRIGDNDSDIKAILSHDGYIWAVKEDGLWAVSNDIPDLVLDDMKNIRSDYTGAASISKTPYMYFSAGAGLEEFYGKVMQDMGPNRDEGLPPWKQGYISALAANAKYLFAAVDNPLISGSDRARVSSVFVWNGQGWHEIFRAPIGERIRSLHWQVPNPSHSSSLWIGMDRWTVDLSFPMYGFSWWKDYLVEKHWDGYVESGWRSDNLVDINKHWALINLFNEYDTAIGSATNDSAVWYYATQVSGEDHFTFNADAFNTDPSEQQAIRSTYVAGKRMRDRVYYDLIGDDDAAIRLRSMVLDYVGRYPTGWTYEIKFLLSEQDDEPMEDLQGDTGDYTAAQIFSFLETAKDDPLPMTMSSVVEEFDNKTVLIEPMSLSVREVTEGESRMLIASMRLIETQV